MSPGPSGCLRRVIITLMPDRPVLRLLRLALSPTPSLPRSCHSA
ncbi:hypothetical protein [Nonomuraea sp. NPDC049784]